MADGDLSAVRAGVLEPCKLVRLDVARGGLYACVLMVCMVMQVLVVRTDLKMTPGKIAAQ